MYQPGPKMRATGNGVYRMSCGIHIIAGEVDLREARCVNLARGLCALLDVYVRAVYITP